MNSGKNRNVEVDLLDGSESEFSGKGRVAVKPGSLANGEFELFKAGRLLFGILFIFFELLEPKAMADAAEKTKGLGFSELGCFLTL